MVVPTISSSQFLESGYSLDSNRRLKSFCLMAGVTNAVYVSSFFLTLRTAAAMPACTPVMTAKLRAWAQGPPICACILFNRSAQ